MSTTASSELVVIIDDSDATRSGQWASAGVSQEYLQTTSSSATKGSSLILKFQGTSIEARGTIGLGTLTNLTCSLDGALLESNILDVQTTSNIPEYHQLLFSAENLSYEPHVLNITQLSTLDPNSRANVYIDYFLITTPSDAEAFGKSLFYDDANSAILYSGSWSSTTGTAQDLQGTLHGASALGSTATFTFNGNGVTVYGNIHNTTVAGPIASFELDGGEETTASVPSPPPGFTLGVASNQELYAASSLVPGNHTLVMTAMEDNAFFLDYIVVTGFQYISTVTSSGTSPSTPSQTGSSQVIPRQSHLNVNAIVGGTIGAECLSHYFFSPCSSGFVGVCVLYGVLKYSLLLMMIFILPLVIQVYLS